MFEGLTLNLALKRGAWVYEFKQKAQLSLTTDTIVAGSVCRLLDWIGFRSFLSFIGNSPKFYTML